MTRTRDFKQVVRARMTRTGESYTAARAALLKQAPPRSASAVSRSVAAPPPSAPANTPPPTAPNVSPRDYARIAGMRDESLKAKTGCGWEKWVHSLDHANAQAWPHREIARYVRETYKQPSWWAQTIAVGYERVRGLRESGQRSGGRYEISKSRTMARGVTTLYRMVREPKQRATWMEGPAVVVRSATPGKVVRMTLGEGTRVEVRLESKGRGKATLVVQHAGIATKGEAERWRAFWGEALARLASTAPSRSRATLST